MKTLSTETTVILDATLGLFHEGRYEDAREVLRATIQDARLFPAGDIVALHVRLAAVEVKDGHPQTSLEVLQEVAPLAEEVIGDDELRGKWFMGVAVAKRNLKDTDGALQAYEGALYNYEKAKRYDLCADILNNIGYLLIELGKAEEAHEYVNRAEKYFSRDAMMLAWFSDTHARAYLQERKWREALKCAALAVSQLVDCKETFKFEEACKTLAEVLKEMKRQEKLPEVREALRAANGSVTEAGRMLNMSHGSINNYVKRYPELLNDRKPVQQPRGRYAKK